MESRIAGNKRGPLYALVLCHQGKSGAGCQRFYDGEPCRMCGQEEFTTPEPWWLDESTVPTLDVFWFAALPACILVSERFAEFAARIEESGVFVEDVTGSLSVRQKPPQGPPQPLAR